MIPRQDYSFPKDAKAVAIFVPGRDSPQRRGDPGLIRQRAVAVAT